MKKVCIIFLLSIIISLTAFGVFGFSGVSNVSGGGSFGFGQSEAVESSYLRIHIRADSNDKAAQAVKYYVRDAVVDYLTPVVANFENKAQAEKGLSGRLGEIEKVAERVLREKGFEYGATAEVKIEEFPTRVYAEYTLPAGRYTALIVRLGSGEGDNWWCVIYPPLCFAVPTGQNVIYKSKIAEIIQKWRQS